MSAKCLPRRAVVIRYVKRPKNTKTKHRAEGRVNTALTIEIEETRATSHQKCVSGGVHKRQRCKTKSCNAHQVRPRDSKCVCASSMMSLSGKKRVIMLCKGV